jgi:hypothetical protein
MYLEQLVFFEFELEVLPSNETVKITGQQFGLGEYGNLTSFSLEVLHHLIFISALMVLQIFLG